MFNMSLPVSLLILAIVVAAFVVWIVFPRKTKPPPKFERGNPLSVWRGNERRSRDQRR